MKKQIAFLALLTAFFASCERQGSAPVAPVISDLVLSTETVNSGSPLDTVYMTFKIVDGDGDLGIQDPTVQDIYLKDNWGTPNPFGFPFPEIPSEVVDPVEGIKATCLLKIPASQYLIVRPTSPQGDSIQYELYIKDRAGHESNHLITPFIKIMP